ncbi:hypothetical protein D9V96_011890 [Zobellia laminariae]|uniref:hypothetical protein n=1 Tax=Zobellia laminariae TaxID=248906 RepID=UPI0012D86D58|nr:hypothetical protein [Zobellia laminariae]
MENIWIIAVSLLFIVTFLFWKVTSGYFKKEYGEKLWKQWGTRLFYWQGVIYTSTGITFLTLHFFK